MVGAVRFELTTSCTRNKRATRLRYAPTLSRRRCRVPGQFATRKLGIIAAQRKENAPEPVNRRACSERLQQGTPRGVLTSERQPHHRSSHSTQPNPPAAPPR